MRGSLWLLILVLRGGRADTTLGTKTSNQKKKSKNIGLSGGGPSRGPGGGDGATQLTWTKFIANLSRQASLAEFLNLLLLESLPRHILTPLMLFFPHKTLISLCVGLKSNEKCFCPWSRKGGHFPCADTGAVGGGGNTFLFKKIAAFTLRKC